MPFEITVPRLGWNMEEGIFLAWLKKPGEMVQVGEPLFSLEGDKAVQEVEAAEAGILHVAPDGPREGDRVAVGTRLGFLLAAGEAAPVVVHTAPASAPATAPPPPQAAPPEPTNNEPPASSPRARRVAEELGVDWTRLQGSGQTGRIRERDVRAAAEERRPAASGTRQTIARRMVESLRTTAPVTLTASADATNLINLREQFKAASARGFGVIPSITDFVVKLTARALKDHPALNSRWEDDRVVPSEGIHIGIAVDTDAGLLVPVIRHVASLGLRQLAAQSHELIEKARARRLTAEEQQGGTFTVSNLGAYGIDAFTPIINPPQCAVLGLGQIRLQPAVVEDRVVARELATLSLTFDHRIVDGAPAARFLDALRRLIENPGPWLMT